MRTIKKVIPISNKIHFGHLFCFSFCTNTFCQNLVNTLLAIKRKKNENFSVTQSQIIWTVYIPLVRISVQYIQYIYHTRNKIYDFIIRKYIFLNWLLNWINNFQIYKLIIRYEWKIKKKKNILWYSFWILTQYNIIHNTITQ